MGAMEYWGKGEAAKGRMMALRTELGEAPEIHKIFAKRLV
jgi:hypothetical protein